MLWRGLTRRCAVCGGGGLFEGWFTMRARCPRCGLRFQRLAGHWTGDLGINTIVTFTVMFAVLLGVTLATWPDVDIAALAVATAAVALGVPVAFFRTAKTLWSAIDLLLRPLEPGEAEPGA